MAETYRPVLVPEPHVAAVEAYLRDLDDLNELTDESRSELKAAEGSDSRPTLFASSETIDELQN